MLRKSKIMHLITTLNTGGTEMQLAKLLARTDQVRFEHCVVSLINPGPVGEMIRAQGIPVYSLGMRRSVPSLSGIFKLWRLIRAKQPLILQTWLYHADLLGLLVGKLARVPVLAWNLRCSLVDMQYYPKLSRFVLRILSRLSAIPDAVVVNSEAGRQAHTHLGYRPRRFDLIPNGFDLERFRPDPSAREWLLREFQLSQDAVIIGLVARHDPMKDHRTFFAAAQEVRARHSDAYFILCGTGVDGQNTELARLMENHGLARYVRLLGPRQDTQKITAGFDIACSSSAFGEGFCNAVGEAMACGVPCVVTDVGDSAQIVGPTGRVVPPRNSEALANALSEFIAYGTEARNSLGMQARARVEELFDINKMAVRYEQLYLSLCSTVSHATIFGETRRSHS
jgi:glycosyltransferase involved in cell wall biosynthesis